MNLKQAIARIEELERRVRELEARPQTQTHIHYTQPQKYVPEPDLRPWKPEIWCAGSGLRG